MNTAFDIVVIGGGPAGMGASVAAASCGARVLLLDEQAAPGGQAHRAIELRSSNGLLSGSDDQDGAALVRALRGSAAVYWPGVAVWQIEPARSGDGFGICFSRDGCSEMVSARRLIIACGAMERPVPIPGWTLPGVMTVGAAQTLLKTGGNVPAGRAVIAGQGPLALLYATQMIKAGVKPSAVLDTSLAGGVGRALPHLAGALRQLPLLLRGLAFMHAIRKAGVPIIRSVTAVEAMGDSQLKTVRYHRQGEWHEMAADLLLLHEGVVPHTHMAMSLGVEHRWNEAQLCWHPVLDGFGQSSVPGVSIAGDCGGIGGWRVAAVDGEIAGLSAAKALGYATRPIGVPQGKRTRAGAMRSFLDALYRPRTTLLSPADNVIVCRCEGKTAGDVRAAVALGCLGPNQVKSFTRCGMGPCQGRCCALTLTTVIAQARGISPAQAGYLRIRPPLKPVSLGELASLAGPPAKAV
jgi:thioredoxin reductase